MKWHTLVLLTALWAISSQTRAQESQRILVQRVDANTELQPVARTLEDALVLELGKRKGVHVVTSGELEQTLAYAQDASDLGCQDSDECLAAVREKLAVPTVVSGRLDRLGTELFLTLAVVDSKNGSVRRRATLQGKDFRDLQGQIPRAVDSALGTAVTESRFTLAEGASLRLAVMPILARGIPANTADALTQILSSALNQIDGVSVINRDDIRAMLDKGQLEADLGCTDNLECIAEIGAALGLSTLVTGTAGKLDTAYVISLRVIDTRKAQVQSRVLESFEGSPGELKNAVKLAAYQLLGIDYQDREGSLKLSVNADEARALLGERSLKIRDGILHVPDLTPGRYSLQIAADPADYHPFQTDIYVAPNEQSVLTFGLREKPPRWYKTWWFWTITGTAVAAAGATSAYLLTRNELPNGSGTVIVQETP